VRRDSWSELSEKGEGEKRVLGWMDELAKLLMLEKEKEERGEESMKVHVERKGQQTNTNQIASGATCK